ncbi:hypothetical protein NKH33_12410 [Mesorhizobium sp. M1182]|uniref:hypothetical protein n=1 Tax=Mesorhizobium sp. M1182 TaxID=2957067 RepID=UPI00333D23DC
MIVSSYDDFLALANLFGPPIMRGAIGLALDCLGFIFLAWDMTRIHDATMRTRPPDDPLTNSIAELRRHAGRRLTGLQNIDQTLRRQGRGQPVTLSDLACLIEELQATTRLSQALTDHAELAIYRQTVEPWAIHGRSSRVNAPAIVLVISGSVFQLLSLIT